MRIQIVSDLHLEAPKAYDLFEIQPAAPVLALIGDIGNAKPHRDDLFGFLLRQLRQFEAVLFVPGNHEAYHSSWRETRALLRGFEAEFRKISNCGEPPLGTFVLLDQNTHCFPAGDSSCSGGAAETIVLGCPLFSHIPPAAEQAVSMGLNDFYQINNDDDEATPWDVASHSLAHARDLAWLNETVARLERTRPAASLLILTHWSPAIDPRTSDPRHANSTISSAFSTDLSKERCFRSPSVKAWAFGHTHYNCDVLVDRPGGAAPIRLVTNQKGYYFQQARGYDNDKTISG
ncbi:hypothetical protein SCUCBS95973_005576 [Sporothrix curviconia]|uniref:Calcineurin-like phosphoesterase domain-containing protein n=1 Tax=Sporothrix curviconia TaxID=1260050 RepID=A0ABP0BZV8_9PEZI